MTINEQYQAVYESAGLIDLSANGRIQVGGSEAVMFLNGLITNDMKGLAENRWMPAIFPTVQGRLIAVVRVIRLSDEQAAKGATPKFILETEEATRPILLKTIERFTMAGDFRVSDVTEATNSFSLQGPQAQELINKVFDVQVPHQHALEIDWSGSRLIILRTARTTEGGFDFIVDKEHALSLKQLLLERGATAVDETTFETLRIEAGAPRYGIDMDETSVVAELNLDEAISYTKGCYVGQEVIIRIKHRGHVAKKQRGFISPEEIAPGATIKSVDGAEIGKITSATFSPHHKNWIGLGFVRYEHSASSTRVSIGTGREVQAMVTDLPIARR